MSKKRAEKKLLERIEARCPQCGNTEDLEIIVRQHDVLLLGCPLCTRRWVESTE